MSKKTKRGRRGRNGSNQGAQSGSITSNSREAPTAGSDQQPAIRHWAQSPWVINTSFFGLFLLVLSAWADIWQVSSVLPLSPELNVQSAQIDDPFSIRFSVFNPSRLFAQKEVFFSCRLDDVRANANDSGFRIRDVVVAAAPQELPIIDPGKTAHFVCPLREFILFTQPIDFARVSAVVNYRTLGNTRDAVTEEFNWDNKSRQWVKGALIN